MLPGLVFFPDLAMGSLSGIERSDEFAVYISTGLSAGKSRTSSPRLQLSVVQSRKFWVRGSHG